MVASLDNSFIGRQGIKTLLNGDYKIWFKTLANSFKDFGKEMMEKSPGLFKSRNDAVMAGIRADIYSRPNALNGKYKAAKNGYGLGVLHEEAFPTSIPEKLPFLGRVFKASESAFGGSALRMRSDLADAMIEKMEKVGVDMLDEKNATAFGNLVTSMTGRGELRKLAPVGDVLNATMFAPKFLKANWNTLTAHMFDKLATKASKKEAAKNLLRIVSSVAGILTISEMLNPGSVEWDPRKTHFGKIKAGDSYYDVTGGMAGLTRFAARIITGETYSSNTKKWSDIYNSEFGKQNALDLTENFFEGKASPLFGAVRDIMKGQNYQGEKPGFVNTSLGLITPISAEMMMEELKKGNDDIFMLMIGEGLGFSPSSATYKGYGKKWDELKEKDSDDYNKALKQVSENFNKRADKLMESREWSRMTQEEQNKALDKIRNEETSKVLRRYGIK